MTELEALALAAWADVSGTRNAPGAIVALQTPGGGKRTTVLRLVGAGDNGDAVIAKRSVARKAQLERLVFEELLPQCDGPMLRFYGAAAEADGEYWWLFTKDAGDVACSPEFADHQAIASQWLGRLHRSIARTGTSHLQAKLPQRGPGYYLAELTSAHDTIRSSMQAGFVEGGDREVLDEVLRSFDTLQSQWAAIERVCAEMPQTLVHGHLERRNLRLRPASSGLVLLVFDWETASWGTPAIDYTGVGLEHVAGPRAEYLAGIASTWPHVTEAHVRRLSVIGSMFKLLLSINGACWGLVENLSDQQALNQQTARDYVTWSIDEIRAYLPWLESVTRLRD